MARRTTRKIKKTFIRMTSLLLTVLALFSSVSPIFAATPYPEATGITSGETYILRNYSSQKYLTLPDYFDIKNGSIWSNNVYQSSRKVNDDYSYAVRINYNKTTGKYTLCPLIFENFGGGYVVYTSDGDVEFSSTATVGAEWIIEYDTKYAAYTLTADDGYRLTAVGNAEGKVNEIDKSEPGNIVIKSADGAVEQLWRITPITVNPHTFKGDGSVTKKNIGTGAEWLFKLSDSEMTNGNVSIDENYTQVLNGGLIDIEQNGKYMIVRMKNIDLSPQRDGDDYAAIQIKVINTNGTTNIRTVVVQDAGTGNNDACQTLPIYSYQRLHTVTVDPSASEFDRSYIVTFSADVDSPTACGWKVDNDEVLEFLCFNDVALVGNSFAIVVAKNVGFTFVNSIISDDQSYEKMIEVQHTSENGVLMSDNVIDFMEIVESGEVKYLRDNTDYLIKTGNNLVLYEDWHLTIQSNSTTTVEGINFAIYHARIADNESIEDSGDNIVSGDSSCYDEIKVKIVGDEVVEYSITVAVNNNHNIYLPNGTYAIRNINQGRYLQLNNNSAEHVELHNSDGGSDQQWIFKYYSDKQAFVIQSVENKSVALTLPSTEEGAKVTVSTLNSSNPSDNQLWRLFYNGEGKYSIKNYSTISSSTVLGANSGISGQNVVMEASNGINIEWKIHIVQFHNWYYQCSNCQEDNGEECKCYRIGFWEKSPTVFLNVDLPSGTSIDVDYCIEAVNTCVGIWNQELGMNMTIVTDSLLKNQSDITINIMAKDKYESLYGDVSDEALGNTKPDYDNFFTGVYGENYVTVNKMKGADIGIFVFNTEQTTEIILHELGHALGIFGHTTVSTDIMYYINYEQNRLVITDRESANLMLLYEEFCEV